MTKPNIKVDWTINVSTLGAALVFALGCIGSWYNLKQDVAVNKAIADTKFSQIDASIGEIKNEVVRSTEEIRRDLRDISRGPATSRPPYR
jgi:hypothetical protein